MTELTSKIESLKQTNTQLGTQLQLEKDQNEKKVRDKVNSAIEQSKTGVEDKIEKLEAKLGTLKEEKKAMNDIISGLKSEKDGLRANVGKLEYLY